MGKNVLRQGAVSIGTSDRVPDQVQVFEFDRSNVLLQLRGLRRAIDAGAEEIVMVSAEGVFSKSLSRTLERSARKLRLAANDLNRLILLVERAHAPNAPARSAPKPKPRNRRLATN